MTDTAAEEALNALARDLVEEISAGRAIELSADPEALELAIFNVRPFQRTQRVHGKVVTEQVHGYQESRGGGPAAPKPGAGGAGVPGAGGLPHPGNLGELGVLGHPQAPRVSPGEDPHVLRSWISEEAWKRGQEEWKKKGEAAWKAHQKVHGDIQSTRDEIFGQPIRPGNAQEAWSNARKRGPDVGDHLHEARQHLEHARSEGAQFPGEDLGKAYHALHEAHRHGTEEVLPRATSKEARKGVEQHLKRIQQHMEDLDKLAGANPKRTRDLLAGTREAGIRAGQRQAPLSAVADAMRKTEYHIGSHMKGGYRPSAWAFSPEEDGPAHLRAAHQALSGKAEPGALSEAYHHLHEAHRIGVERALAMSESPEDKQAVREGLDLIQQHMEDLDKITGADSKRTRQVLGTVSEQGERASRAAERAEEEKRTVPPWLEPGQKVYDVRGGKEMPGTVVEAKQGTYGPRVTIHYPGRVGTVDMSLDAVKELVRPLGEKPEGEGRLLPSTAEASKKTGMEGELTKAKAQALVGKRVSATGEPGGHGWLAHRMSGGGEGTVTEVPKEIFDMGAETWEPNPGNYVHVVWDNVPKGAGAAPAPIEALKEVVPEPPKGAAAVHPHLGGHLARTKGETISGRAYSHLPQPVQVPPPAAPSPETRQLEQQGKRIEGYAQRAEQRRQADLEEHVREMRAREMTARGQAPPGEYAPLSDQDFAHHAQQLEQAVDEAIRAGKATDQTYALDAAGKVWDPDRSMLHRDIVKDYMDKQIDVPTQRQAIMMGGPPGSGKTSLLHKHPDIDLKDYAEINTDDFKEELARRGMVPEVPGLSPLEASALVHEESAYLADLAAAELQKRGKNLVFDGTMRNLDVARGRIDELKKHGYSVNAMFVDLPVPESAKRAEGRYRKGLEGYRKGTNPLGGRHVPRGIIASGEAGGSRDTFDALRGEFHHWETYDNSTGKPVKTGSGGEAPREPGTGIPSVEELRRHLNTPAGSELAQKGGAGEAAARAAETGASAVPEVPLTHDKVPATMGAEAYTQ